jgi:hypothetical protein
MLCGINNLHQRETSWFESIGQGGRAASFLTAVTLPPSSIILNLKIFSR